MQRYPALLVQQGTVKEKAETNGLSMRKSHLRPRAGLYGAKDSGGKCLNTS